MKIFVTGFHRAGTHSAAKELAHKHGLTYYEESHISWDSFKKAKKLPDNSVLQCPFLAHKTLELAKIGKVYWCIRDRIATVTSMRNIELRTDAWMIVKDFKKEFPKDSIWETIEYKSGSQDCYDGFVRYYNLMYKVKSHFLKTVFKNLCETITLEDADYYDKETSIAFVRKLKDRELRAIC